MKIAYVSFEFRPVTAGGIGTYVTNITTYMAQRGHQIYLVTDCFTPETMEHLPAGVTLVPFKAAEVDSKFQYINALQGYSDRVYHTLKELDNQVGLDLVEFPENNALGFTSIRAKKLLNAFACTTLHVKLHVPNRLLWEIQGKLNYRYQDYITCYMEDYCIRNADLVVSPSAVLVDYVAEHHGVKALRSPYPLPIITDSQPVNFETEQIRRVLFMGTIQALKGVDFFIKAACLVLEKNPDFCFEIYGGDTNTALFEGSYQRYLTTLIPDQYREKIVFKGVKTGYRQVVQTMLSACFCVFPSRWDNWPNVCLEAMSVGRVVIGSRKGGMSEMITHGIDGFLVDPEQPEQIARIILENAFDPKLLAEIGERAKHSVQKWCDPDRACQQIEETYRLAVPVRDWISKQQPLVSVVIVLHNQGYVLHETLASIQASRYENVEIVVVNAGSTDLPTIEFFEELTGPVKKIKQNRNGIGSAYNSGVRAGKGEFIMFIAGSDKPDPRFLELAVQALLNNPDLACIGSYSRCFDGSEEGQSYLGPVPEIILFNNCIAGSMILCRRAAWEQVGGFSEVRISEENWDFQINLFTHDLKTDILPLELHHNRYNFDRRQQEDQPHLREIIQYFLHKYSVLLDRYPQPVALSLTYLWTTAEDKVIKLADWSERQGKWISQLESGVGWFEASLEAGKSQSENQQKWISQLENFKSFLETNIEKQQARLEEQTAYIRQLEDDRKRLVELVQNFEQGRFIRLSAFVNKLKVRLLNRMKSKRENDLLIPDSTTSPGTSKAEGLPYQDFAGATSPVRLENTAPIFEPVSIVAANAYSTPLPAVTDPSHTFSGAASPAARVETADPRVATTLPHLYSERSKLFDVTLSQPEISAASLSIIQTAPVYMTISERLMLYALVISLRPERYLEIGTLKGGSALITATALNCLNSDGILVCVDPAPQIEPETWQKLQHRTTLVQGYSPEILPRSFEVAGGAFDLVLIDGDHSYEGVSRDAEGVLPYLAEGAFIIFHDNFFVDINRALLEFANKHQDCIRDLGPITREYTRDIEYRRNWGGLRLMQLCQNPSTANLLPLDTSDTGR